MQAQFLNLGKFTQTSIYSNEHALYFFYILYSKKMSVRNNSKVTYRLCDNKLKYFFIIFSAMYFQKKYTCNNSYFYTLKTHIHYTYSLNHATYLSHIKQMYVKDQTLTQYISNYPIQQKQFACLNCPQLQAPNR